jgi:hypothetical protein
METHQIHSFSKTRFRRIIPGKVKNDEVGSPCNRFECIGIASRDHYLKGTPAISVPMLKTIDYGQEILPAEVYIQASETDRIKKPVGIVLQPGNISIPATEIIKYPVTALQLQVGNMQSAIRIVKYFPVQIAVVQVITVWLKSFCQGAENHFPDPSNVRNKVHSNPKLKYQSLHRNLIFPYPGVVSRNISRIKTPFIFNLLLILRSLCLSFF